MRKYRKKPIVVDAVRYVPGTPERDMIDILEGCIGWEQLDDGIKIPTPHGSWLVKPGYWVVKSPDGICAMDHETFEATYEPACELVG